MTTGMTGGGHTYTMPAVPGAALPEGTPAPAQPPAAGGGFWGDLWNEGVVNPTKQVGAGLMNAAAGANRLTANAADLADKAAGKIADLTGTSKGGAFESVRNWARQNQQEQEQTAARLAGGRTDFPSALYRGASQGVAELPEYVIASEAAGPAVGMGALGGLREADKGAGAALKAAAEGTLMGAALHVMGPASRPIRLTGAASMAYAQSRLNGASNSEALANAVSMGAMAAQSPGGLNAHEIRGLLAGAGKEPVEQTVDGARISNPAAKAIERMKAGAGGQGPGAGESASGEAQGGPVAAPAGGEGVSATQQEGRPGGPPHNNTEAGETELNQGPGAGGQGPEDRGQGPVRGSEPAPGEPGWIGEIPRGDVKIDAPRFQFKANVGQGGVGDEFRDVSKWDPEKAGILSVWKDPADDQTYSVNGHHRVDMANRAENAPENLPVRYLSARNAQEARLKGALINIAEGHGESTDAAKVFRDSGMTPEELQAQGVSLKGKVTSEGMALSKLAQPIFDDVISGELTPARGAVIGAGVAGHADQVAVYDLMKAQEKAGKRPTNDQVAELVRLNNAAPTKTESTADQAQGGLFGAEEMTRSLLPEKARVSDYIRKQLGTEKRLFGAVGSQAAAEKLAETGNVIKAGENAQQAQNANQGILLYDKLSTKAGPIAQTLDRAAQAIADGENENEVKQRAYREIRAGLRDQANQLSGVSAGNDRGTEGSAPRGSGEAGAGEHDRAAENVAPADIERRANDNLQNNLAGLAKAYRAKFGNEISTDNAREIVSPEYAASKEARTEFSEATQKPAGVLSDFLFDQALQHPDPEKPRVVRMTAGGPGAGKTTALREIPELSDAQFVYDSNLPVKKTAVEKIEAAKAAGNRVDVVFVHRDPVKALTGGVLPRAMEEGRVVGLDAHARMYRDAARNFASLREKYASDPAVRFTAFDNTGGPGSTRRMDLADATQIRYSTKELAPRLRAALESEYAAGRISEPVYRATLGASSQGAAGGVPRDRGPGASAPGSEGAAGRVALGDSGRSNAPGSEPERAGAAEVQADRLAAEPQARQPLSNVRGSEPAPEGERGPATGEAKPATPGAAPTPQPISKADDGIYFGSGLGALDPLLRETKAEGDRLRVARNEALAAAKAADGTPGERRAGVALRMYFTAERDLWGARVNQAIDRTDRTVLPKIQQREAVGIMREFRHRPGELAQFIDGTHPFLQELRGGERQGSLFHATDDPAKRLEPLMPVMREAQRMLTNPTAEESKADRLYTNIAQKSLDEGRAGGWLESRWQSDEYLPHLLNEKGKGEVAAPPSLRGRAMGNIGKYFGFAERRSDPYPTMIHAVADGVVPKTMDPSAAFRIHGDAFARARATDLLEAQMAQSGMGTWSGGGENVPEGWEQLAPHSEEFKKLFGSQDPETGEIKVGKQGLYVPPFVAKALAPITDPDYNPKLGNGLFGKVRTFQRGLKQAILGLSAYHLLTENVMATTDSPSVMLRALWRDRRDTDAFVSDEKDMIAHGGVTPIEGKTMDAYRSLRPGTIPTRGEVIRGHVPTANWWLDQADKITRFTFDNIQRRFKVTSFALHRDAWMNQNPGASEGQMREAKRGIASYVNGVYGGLHWENIGIGKASLEWGRLTFLAPDWSGSNIVLAKYATLDRNFSGREMLPFADRGVKGAVTKEAAQSRLARQFWTRQAVAGLVATQLASLMVGHRFSRRVFQVFEGLNSKGEEVYQNWFFRGSALDAISEKTKVQEHGLLTGTGNFIGSKLAPVTKAASHIYTGLDDRGREIAPKDLNPVANTLRSLASTMMDLSPVPLIVRNLAKTAVGDGSDEYLWSERIMGMFGPPAQHVAPPGYVKTANGLELEKPKPPAASILEQAWTGKRAGKPPAKESPEMRRLLKGR